MEKELEKKESLTVNQIAAGVCLGNLLSGAILGLAWIICAALGVRPW